MSDTAYLVWMIATAVMTITVLTLGTLAAAGMLPARQRRRPPAQHVQVLPATARHRDAEAEERRPRAA